MQKLLRTVLFFLTTTMPTTTTTTTPAKRSTSFAAATSKLTNRGPTTRVSSNQRGGCRCWLRRFGWMGTLVVWMFLLVVVVLHQKLFLFLNLDLDLNDFATFRNNNNNNIHHDKNDDTVLIAPPTSSLRTQQRRTETADVEIIRQPKPEQTKPPEEPRRPTPPSEQQQQPKKRGRQYTVSFQTRQGKWRHPIRPLHHVSLQDLPDLAAPAALQQPSSPPPQGGESSSRIYNNNNNNNSSSSSNNVQRGEKQWILHQLHEAGVERLDPNVVAQLPADAQIQHLYYSSSSTSSTLGHPIVRGMNTCAAYRQRVPREQRYVGAAGLFNSGTTALSIYLQHNLVRRLPIWSQLSNQQKARATMTDFEYQVPWGKHRLFRFHDDITYRRKDWPVDILDPNHVLPIVIVRDPLFWMQSMCDSPYTLQWEPQPAKGEYHKINNQCPHILRNPSSNTNTTGPTTIPVSLPTQGKAHFASLAHLWKAWYQEYLVLPQSSVHQEDPKKPLASSPPPPLQRLVIRVEELLFHPRAVMERIEQCVLGNETEPETNGSTATRHHQQQQQQQQENDDRFVYLVGRSKWSQEYRKPQSSMISAMIKYGGGTMARHNRVAHWRPEEVDYLNKLLGDMMDELGYRRGEAKSVSSSAARDH